MKPLFLTIALCTATSAAVAAPADAPPHILIPLTATDQKPSDPMRAHLAALKLDPTQLQGSGWTLLKQLPAWAHEAKSREIAFIPPRPLLVHDYRYAVILGPGGTLVVIRAGGLEDRHEVFQRISKTTPPEPTPAAPTQTNAQP